MRKLREKYTDLDISERTLRRYVAKVRKQVCVKQPRYYEPVLDMVPGQQCQVDPGELRNVMIGGQETTVYFVVFVLSYSRLMHVSFTLKPIDTTEFIRMHDIALRYFGGCPNELVYDQTKLVVINEKYRELTLNQRMAEYACRAGFTIRACEGYDPESKGKVEAGVKYVKINALYGETFKDVEDLQNYLDNWLETVANIRVHGTTGKQPQAYYDESERHTMQPYFTPDNVHQDGQQMTRNADKTGLISYKSNKYSVPMLFQRKQVAIKVDANKLIIIDQHSHVEIACHNIYNGQGKTIKNTHHYRDQAVKIAELEQALCKQLGDEQASRLCRLLKATLPKIYRDQLAGVIAIIKRLGVPSAAQMTQLCQRDQLTARQFEGLLDVLKAAPINIQPESKITTGALNRYQHLTTNYGEANELH